MRNGSWWCASTCSRPTEPRKRSFYARSCRRSNTASAASPVFPESDRRAPQPQRVRKLRFQHCRWVRFAMSARSGVFTKYVIDFVDAKFKVSNDVSAISAGDFLLDADVTVTMARDTAGTTFTITLYNLPQNQLDALDAAINPKNYQQSVKIQLGYFETKALQVVDGIYDKIESKVAA